MRKLLLALAVVTMVACGGESSTGPKLVPVEAAPAVSATNKSPTLSGPSEFLGRWKDDMLLCEVQFENASPDWEALDGYLVVRNQRRTEDDGWRNVGKATRLGLTGEDLSRILGRGWRFANAGPARVGMVVKFGKGRSHEVKREVRTEFTCRPK